MGQHSLGLIEAGEREVFLRVVGALPSDTTAALQLQALQSSYRDIVISDPSRGGRKPQDDGRLHVAYLEEAGPEILTDCLRSGYAAIVAKKSDMTDLQAALSSVRSGGVFLDRVFADTLLRAIDGEADADVGDPSVLSQRERDVLTFIAKGLSLKQIAAETGLSVKTIDTYKSRAMRKLGLSDRAEVYSYAMANGLLA